MTIKVAINGYGRIGCNILRAKYESGCDDIHIVAINDLGDAQTNAHMTRIAEIQEAAAADRLAARQG